MPGADTTQNLFTMKIEICYVYLCKALPFYELSLFLFFSPSASLYLSLCVSFSCKRLFNFQADKKFCDTLQKAQLCVVIWIISCSKMLVVLVKFKLSTCTQIYVTEQQRLPYYTYTYLKFTSYQKSWFHLQFNLIKKKRRQNIGHETKGEKLNQDERITSDRCGRQTKKKV